jgi:uncharacterized protein (UPF0332 family)
MTGLWNKARDAATEARLLFEADRYDGACSRAYYAMFNAARAILIAEGIEPGSIKTHKTVQRLFSLHFVGKGLFDEDDGRALRRAGESRNLADYDDVNIGRTRALAVMEAMERFMAAAECIVARSDNETDT